MTLEKWHENEFHRAHLAEVLEDPVVIRALSVLEGANSPQFRAGVSATDLALVHAFQAGVHHVRKALFALTTRPEPDTPALGEWEGGHVFPSDPVSE